MSIRIEQVDSNRQRSSAFDLGIMAPASGWVLIALCLAYATTAICLYPDRYFELSQMYAEKFVRLLPMLLACGLGVAALVHARQNPARFMMDTLKQRWLRAAPVIFLFFVGMTTFTTFKINIPNIVPFYADQILADLDHWLHGADVWRWTHGIVSKPVSAVIFFCYEYVWVLQWFGTLLFVAFWKGQAERLRYLWAFSLTMFLCGTIVPILLASTGPIFHDQFVGGNRFAELSAALEANEHAQIVLGYANYLLAAYQSGQSELGGGISAMPSMHIALVTLNAFFLASFGRWYAVVGWGFAAIILFGSVYTGWHYAVDGYLAIIIVSTLWYLTGRAILPAADKRA